MSIRLRSGLTRGWRTSSVLEVGSGHRPTRNATVLVDRYLDPRERTAPLETGGRPFVLADGEALPFTDKSFARCVARQVLEHAVDVEAFGAEMGRVARAGLVETPSPLAELLLRPREYHRWILSRCGGTLVYWPRSALPVAPQQGDAFERLYGRNLLYYLATQTQINHFVTRYEWSGSLDMRPGTADELDRIIKGSLDTMTTRLPAQFLCILRGGLRLLVNKGHLAS